MTEKDKMTAGLPYHADHITLVTLRSNVRKLLGAYNELGLHKSDYYTEIIKKIFGEIGVRGWVEPPFYCDYGFNIIAGNDFYMNFDCVILDVAPVTIGHNVMCGPKVQLLTATHSLNANERNFSGTELARPISIGNRVWLGAGAIVCPGVKIGDEAVIGAGSVVTRDIPSGVFAAGNPCKVIRKI